MERKIIDEWPIDAKYTAVKFSDDTYGLKQFIANKGDLFEDDLVVLYSPKIDSMRCFDTSEHLVGIRKFVEFLDDVVVKEGKENGKVKINFSIDSLAEGAGKELIERELSDISTTSTIQMQIQQRNVV